MKRIFLSFIFIFLLFTPKNAGAIALIRDAEIEQLLHDYSSPIFEAAGIPASSVRILLVNDDSLNAYVAGGMNMFIHTGLLTRSKTPEMVIGVIAHETGHIDGGHLIKISQEYEDLSLQSVLSTVLGAAVTVAGLPDAGAAILIGGAHVSGRQLASYSREQEVAADQAALRYLKSTDQSAQGLLDVMQILQRDSVLNFDALDQYAQSHPLTSQRISHLRSYLAGEPKHSESKFAERHERMVAKLEGFLNKSDYVLQKYVDDSIASRYARAVAYYRDGKVDKSFVELDAMLVAEPQNPFFNELKGQILAENERILEAEEYYVKADGYFPNSALLLHELGKLQIANGKTKQGIVSLEQAAKIEPDNSTTWHILAITYGRQNDQARLKFSLAMEANAKNKKDEAIEYAKQAKSLFPKNSAEWLAMNDLLNDVKNRKKKEDD
jgi:predicted Zn-dependent protease